MDLAYEEACILYAAYAADQEDNYGPDRRRALTATPCPLMDMILFIYRGEGGRLRHAGRGRSEQDIDDAYEQITDAQAQMLGAQLHPHGART